MDNKKYFVSLRNTFLSHEDQEKRLQKQLHDLMSFMQSQQQMVYAKAIRSTWRSRYFEHFACPP
eukprot:9511385-Prorocentrum_lima.AAC.1